MSTSMNIRIKELEEKFEEIHAPLQANEEFALYKELNLLGDYCFQHFDNENTVEILKVIDNIYRKNNLYSCNAIENEFFTVLAMQIEPTALTNQLYKMPESLWAVYLKILIETQKQIKL